MNEQGRDLVIVGASNFLFPMGSLIVLAVVVALKRSSNGPASVAGAG